MLSGKTSLLLALLFGLLAGAVAVASVRAQQRRARQGWDTVQVLCARVDVSEGAELEAGMLAVRELPAKFVTDSFLRVGPDGQPRESPVGQRLIAPLKAGDPILASHLAANRGAELASMVRPKGRAVTIDVQERSAVGLWVRPNDHVDVVGSFRDAATQQLRAQTLLQNVVVLATGRLTAGTAAPSEEDGRYQSVTVLVLPEEAQLLTLAQELGTLTLLLRNPDDLDTSERHEPIDQKALFAGDRASELQQKRTRTLQIIRGSRSVETATLPREP